MCGIGGYIVFDGEPLKYSSNLMAVASAIRHRGPDASGTDFFDDGGFCHVRLSIIDLNPEANQPMKTKSGRYTIVFNGEIYNYIELKVELEREGFRFLTNSDTEVILAAYERWGSSCLKKFDGMFAFAIWDKQSGKLFCARDRFGEKPFYYFKDSGTFFFCSEIKGLWEFNIQKKINRRRLFASIVYDSLVLPEHNRETYYEDIYQLEPGTFMSLEKNGNMHFEKYYSLEIRSRGITMEDACEELKSILVQSVERRMRADVPWGTSLSGGIDSSIIASIVAEQTKKFSTYSARYHNYDKDEGTYINLVTNRFGLKNITTYPDPDNFISELDKLHWYFDNEPLLSTSVYSQFCVMRAASEDGTKVLIDGQGADEVFAGYPAYRDEYYGYLLENKFVDELQRELNALHEIHGLLFNHDYLKRRNTIVAKLISKLRIYKQRLVGVKGYNKKFIQLGSSISGNDAAYGLTLKQTLHRTLFNGQLQDLLKNADRNSMANAVEVRLPFLNNQLIEFAMSLPDSFFIKNGYLKYVLRQAFAGNVPAEILARKDKIGFFTPQQQWLSSEKFKEKANSARKILIQKDIITEDNKNDVWKIITTSYLFKDA